MRKDRKLAAVALLLAIFFLWLFVAELFMKTSGQDAAKLQLAAKFSPPSSRLFRQTALLLLQQGVNEKNSDQIRESIRFAQKAIHVNPLDYQAHYYLAKAYLQFASTDGGYFDRAVASLKRAALIRGQNKPIALDCGTIFLSLWPLLEEEDKTFTADMLKRVMPELSWPEFVPLLEMWTLYVQDQPLLMGLLNQKPEFFRPTADRMVSEGVPLSRRWELLDLHESYTLDQWKRLYNEWVMRGTTSLDELRSMFHHLQGIRGYFRLKTGSVFPVQKLAELRRTLLLAIIADLLESPATARDPKQAAQLEDYIRSYIAANTALVDLGALQKLLLERNYFKSNDFASLHLKTLISFKMGGYGDIIREIEALRQSISFVKKEQLADYTAILLLLTDSYYASKLLTSAETIARELYQNQPENPEVLYRLLKIESILGTEETADKALNERLAKVQESRRLTLERPDGSYDVYLMESPEIEIIPSASLVQQLMLQRRLLQVFIGDDIAFECYSDALPEKIVIAPPFTAPEQKVTLRVALQ